jgi:subtilisin family serine protease
LRGKLDSRLHQRLRELETRQRRGEPDDPALAAERVGVWVHFSGDLEAAKEAGLRIDNVAGGVAGGTVALSDLEAVAAAESVLSVRSVQEYRTLLNNSVPAIHADHASVATVGGGSGAGVIVGVVDTGIDVLHHNFRKQDGTTRILSLFDLTIRQTISIPAGAAAGTFTLAWAGPAKPRLPSPVPTTGPLPYTATAAAIQAALLALRSAAGAAVITAADVTVGGGPLPGTPVTVDFAGQYANKEVTVLVALTSTGSASTEVVVTPGRELSASDINGFIANPSQGVPSIDTVGHGTHVAGIAAGNGSQSGNCHGSNTFIGVAPEADLVIVKVPFETAVRDPVVQGAEYVFTQAVSQNKAAVVNVSLGSGVGPHDGTTGEEQSLNQLLLNQSGQPVPGRAIVVASGNDGAGTDSTNTNGGYHARKSIPAKGSATISFLIQSGDTTSDSVELWYEGEARLQVTVTPPPPAPAAAMYAATGPIAPPTAGSPQHISLTVASVTPGQLAAADGFISHEINSPPTAWPQHLGHPRNKNQISLLLNPPPPATPPAAGTTPPPNPIAPGTWTITLTETAGVATNVDAWIPSSHAKIHAGTQASFIPADQDRTRTVASPGTATEVITLGSYDYRENTLADSSGRGPTLETSGFQVRKPDLCAPGVQISSAKADLRDPGCWCDCCYDFYIDMSGTSMASPHVSGIVALMFGKNKQLTHEEVRGFLTGSAQPPDPITGPTLPNDEWGAGMVDAKEALGHVVAQAAASPDLARGAPIPILPRAANWTDYVVTPRRLAALRARAHGSPLGTLVAALVSTHFDEVKRLVNTNRRVLVVWHRMGGPELLRQAMRYADGRPLEMPANAWGQPGARRRADRTSLIEWFERMLELLYDYGSPSLRADVARYRPLALELAATLLGDHDERQLAG